MNQTRFSNAAKSGPAQKTVKLIATSLVVAAIFGGGYFYRGHPLVSDVYATTNAVATQTAPAAPAPENATGTPPQTVGRNLSTLPDFADLAASEGPAVVNISVSGTIKSGEDEAEGPSINGMPQLDPNDPFYELFRHFQMPPQQRGSTPVQALGSGFILNSNGVILTNAHVVADADEVVVKLTDKREFKARVIGLDKPADVAVLKIDAHNLPTVKIGNPEKVRVGEWVVAIGSPFGFENTVTAGIVSAKSRSLPDENYVPFLQTDVPINPGNSGGPLFNLNGEVIGINSQIFSRSGGYQGLSFAIPIDVAMKVEQQLYDHGKVSRGRLGVGIQTVTQDLANSFGLANPAGALVSSVEKDSPAEKAGIAPGDVILKFNGKSIDRSEQLPPLVADVTPGAAATVEVWHNGKAREVTVHVAAMKSAETRANADAPAKGKLGLAVRPLTDDEQKQADVAQGVIVQNVTDGPAAKAGIHSGDIILAVNGETIATPEQLRALVDKYHKNLALLVMRGDRKLFVPITIG